MNKTDFLASLRKELNGVPEEEIVQRLSFYGEMIEDRMEEGMTEEDAVASLGSACQIAEQMIADIPLTKIVKQKLSSKRKRSSWEVALLALGFPIWGSLVLSAAAVAFSLYVSGLAVIVSLWAAAFSFGAGAIGGGIAALYFACTGNALTGVVFFAVALALAGLCIFSYYGCKAVTKGFFLTTKKTILATKRKLVKNKTQKEAHHEA